MSSTPRNILVFDVGSSALKAAVFDPAGVIIARAEADYAGGGAAHRQSPLDWWQAAVIAARDVGPEDVGAIALTGTMENLIPVAENGAPLGDAILYSDPCGAPYLEELATALEEADAATICGNTLEPLMTAFKLQWLKEHDFNSWIGARWFLPGSKDFLALRLTGEAATDPTCAATTGLMDMATRDWSAPLRTIHGLERRRLPHIRPATEIIGQMTTLAAAELGLEAGIPVVNGCGDGGTTTMGGGADSADDVSLYIGTTGWVARVAGSAALATRSQFYRLPHPVGDGIIEIAPILSAGRRPNGPETPSASGSNPQRSWHGKRTSPRGTWCFCPISAASARRSSTSTYAVRFWGSHRATGRPNSITPCLKGWRLPSMQT